MFLKFDSMFGRSVSSAIVVDSNDVSVVIDVVDVVIVVVDVDVVIVVADVDDDDDEGKISGGGRPTWGRFR